MESKEEEIVMRELSLFSGAGGGLLATKHLLGWETIGYVEINDYCQRVIAQRIKDGYLDNAPIFTDIRAFIDSGCCEFYKGITDIVTGGFPCQDISCAGSGKGLNGERSGLWQEMSQIICRVKPKYVLVENSPMLTIRGLGTILRDLAQMGFDAKWGCLSASQIGASHNRERMWIVANSKKVYGISCNPEKRINIQKLRGLHTKQKIKSRLSGRYDGVGDWMDRLKAIGNGQVPAVVEVAWKVLSGDQL